ncbi:hypothetical protein TVAG_051030 [Trichomonas vaginalis G3]|uniref:Uncharacterized protein n=1 Tax=Trichomonas vaginalis (strain ATCC PRA-98 / G3) TaxID=412133 RepID=A2EER2_TRIV3|nr:hypothetical protein TVAGG3_0981980 [Trichomonas vaginalis G3]EAY08868.1 hypothetical protein TVAG_051030 [Trichomonas vaginalis G3]KAI5489363.1 hypothetical protein TVAGG3_0981980 [Trichomonas vaginalis G3]|eukprot:XP_001321091.1 hypothetical protein [Trichomonas vaginalis G3]
MNNTSFLSTKNRYKEKKLNELQEIVELQNEEIIRLKNEYKQLINTINQTESASSQTDIILKKKIASLQSELKNLDTRTTILKSHSSVAHSRMINELQTEHQDNIIKTRIKYESKIAELQLQNKNNTPVADILSKIDTTRSKISESLKEKMDQNEKQIQNELASLSDKTKDLEQYCTQLEQKIKQKRNLIQEETDKFKNYITKSEELHKRRTIAIDESEASIKEQYEMFEKSQLAEINSIRDKNNSSLEKIRGKIAEQRNKVFKMKQSIASGRTDISTSVDEAQREKTKLSKQLDDQIYSSYTDGEKSMMKVIKREYVDRQYLMKRLAAYKEQMNEIKKSRNEILTEVKRLDFMLYGKGGKYQRKK